MAWPTDRAVQAFDRPPRALAQRALAHAGGAARARTTPRSSSACPPPSATQLTDRAQAGLREQFAQDQVRAATPPDCQRTAAAPRWLRERHPVGPRRASGCAVTSTAAPSCRERLDEIDDLAPRLRRSVPVLPLAVGVAAEQAWLARASSTRRGRFGLTLPGGRPLPPWAERALTGATAAVITLGITGALLAGGRGDRDRRDEVPFASAAHGASRCGAGDGESALGGTGDTPRSHQRGCRPRGRPAHPRRRRPHRRSRIPHRSRLPDPARPAAPPTPPTSPPPPAPVEPGAPDPVEPPPTPPTGPPPLVIRVDDDTGISVGEDCTGVEVLGIVIGCDPPSGTEAPPLLGGLGLGL